MGLKLHVWTTNPRSASFDGGVIVKLIGVYLRDMPPGEQTYKKAALRFEKDSNLGEFESFLRNFSH